VIVTDNSSRIVAFSCAVCGNNRWSVVGTAWTRLSDNKRLPPNHMLILDKATRVWMSKEELAAQMPVSGIVEGSAISLGSGDVGVSFPSIGYLSLDAKNAKVLTGDAFPIPLHSARECMMLKFKLENFPEHQPVHAKRYEVYNNLTIITQTDCGSKYQSADVLQPSWPDIRGCVKNVNVAFGFQKPIVKKQYSFTLASFLRFCMKDHCILFKGLGSLQSDIKQKYAQEIQQMNKFFKLQKKEMSLLDSYLILMMTGGKYPYSFQEEIDSKKRKADEMKGEAAKEDVTIVQDDVEEFPYESESVFSVTALAFTLQSNLVVLYDMCFDLFLLILAVSTEKALYNNSEIQSLLHKVSIVQEKLHDRSGFSTEEIQVVGQHVHTIFAPKLVRSIVDTCLDT